MDEVEFVQKEEMAMGPGDEGGTSQGSCQIDICFQHVKFQHVRFMCEKEFLTSFMGLRGEPVSLFRWRLGGWGAIWT